MKFNTPHRRLNPLTGEWILVSPQRTQRPWLGQIEKVPSEELPSYDPSCYLCPGNQRAGSKRNPVFTSTFVFDNDFPALMKTSEEQEPDESVTSDKSLFVAEKESGICRVVCFSPRHDLTLPELTQAQVEEIVRTWSSQTKELGNMDFVRYVQVFENKGAMMGCSNPHPHSQIWANSQIPVEPHKELICQEEYLQKNGTCLLCDTLAAECQNGERLVASNEHFYALVPFWAVWPFELLIIGRRHVPSLPDLKEIEVNGLADILRRVTARYDNLFEISFPYSMGFHQQPMDGKQYPGWHWHAHFYPPLLRSATVRKFMVGYEMLAMPQRDLTPEAAAERLRTLSDVHYKLNA